MRRSVASRTVFTAVAALCTVIAPAARAAEPGAVESVCDLIASASAQYGLPTNYFTRLIWQESRFRPNAVSPAGAQGVAQFMPQTAADRALADPFATRDALFASAAYLHELRATFGNLGLAAAAYNAGPGRLSRWLSGHSGSLPQETLDYVVAVTGHDVTEWTAATKPSEREEKDFSCAHFATLAATGSHRGTPSDTGETKEWAVILVGNPQREKAMAEYRIMQSTFSKVLGGLQPSVVHRRISGLQIARYIVEIERDTRAAAADLCSRLARGGGNCFVLRTALRGAVPAKPVAPPKTDLSLQ